MDRPIQPSDLKVFFSRQGSHLFVADGSRVYDISDDLISDLASWFESGIKASTVDDLLEVLGGHRAPYLQRRAATLPPVRSLSLNIAQVCNMRCTYCYADFGKFGQDVQ